MQPTPALQKTWPSRTRKETEHSHVWKFGAIPFWDSPKVVERACKQVHEAAIRTVAFDKPRCQVTKPKQFWLPRACLVCLLLLARGQTVCQRVRVPFQRTSSPPAMMSPPTHLAGRGVATNLETDASYSAMGGRHIRAALDELVGCWSESVDYWCALALAVTFPFTISNPWLKNLCSSRYMVQAL